MLKKSSCIDATKNLTASNNRELNSLKDEMKSKFLKKSALQARVGALLQRLAGMFHSEKSDYFPMLLL